MDILHTNSTYKYSTYIVWSRGGARVPRSAMDVQALQRLIYGLEDLSASCFYCGRPCRGQGDGWEWNAAKGSEHPMHSYPYDPIKFRSFWGINLIWTALKTAVQTFDSRLQLLGQATQRMVTVAASLSEPHGTRRPSRSRSCCSCQRPARMPNWPSAPPMRRWLLLICRTWRRGGAARFRGSTPQRTSPVQNNGR